MQFKESMKAMVLYCFKDKSNKNFIKFGGSKAMYVNTDLWILELQLLWKEDFLILMKTSQVRGGFTDY